MGILLGALLSPGAAWAVGTLAQLSTTGPLSGSEADLLAGRMPSTTTVEDATGRPIAWLYRQDRTPVAFSQIAPTMTAAIVAVEDQGFWSEGAIAPAAVVRAAVADARAGHIVQGASTLSQQYVKNYRELVTATDPAQRQAAVAQNLGRKLRDIRLAAQLERSASKQQILADYLNVVSFGHGAFGIASAARTYFATTPDRLTLDEAALLAGVVNNPSQFDPVDHPAAATGRRNVVLAAMAGQGVITTAAARAAAAAPLGVLAPLNTRPEGCYAAGDAGFFCDEAVHYLETHGLSAGELHTGGYAVRTTMDPRAQAAATAATARTASPTNPHAADVLSLVAPGADRHRILALASSRRFGTDGRSGETAVDQPVAPVPFGAGSVYKMFTAAVALEKGLGIDDTIPVPPTYSTPAYRTADGSPAVVHNVGGYPPRETLTQALATSPNTAFVRLEQLVGLDRVVATAESLGLRSLTRPAQGGDPSTSPGSRIVAGHDLSFTLGVTPTSPLELSNVAATLASHGTWCPPTPIDTVTDASGRPAALTHLTRCHQAVPAPVARTLAHGLGQDAVSGTSAGAARATDWSRPVSAKTGTTENYESTAFVGFTSGLAGASMVFDDTSRPGPLCAGPPVHACSSGSLYGGDAAARTWYRAANTILAGHPVTPLPAAAPTLEHGHPLA